MKFFFRCKTKENIIELENQDVIAYEYHSFARFTTSEFDVKISFKIDELNQNHMNYLRKWANKKHGDEKFYKKISFGIISNEKIIKETIFFHAYICNFSEEFDFRKSNFLVSLYIKQKEDKHKGVMNFPAIIKKRKIFKVDSPKPNPKPNPIIQNNEFKEENLRLFKQRLAQQQGMIPEYAEILIKKFDYANEIAQDVFLSYVHNNAVKITSLEENQISKYFIKLKYIQMDFQKDLLTKDMEGTTYFHEHGHLIDFITVNTRKANYEGLISGDSEFSKLLREDFEDCVKQSQEEHGIDREQAYAKISEILREKFIEYSSISDLFKAMSDGQCGGLYMHRAEYWKQKSTLEIEATAHFFEAQFDPNRLEAIKKFFPKSSVRFEERLRFMYENVIM